MYAVGGEKVVEEGFSMMGVQYIRHQRPSNNSSHYSNFQTYKTK